MPELFLGKVSYLEMCPRFRGVLREGFNCIKPGVLLGKLVALYTLRTNYNQQLTLRLSPFRIKSAFSVYS